MIHKVGIHIVQGVTVPVPGCYAAGLVHERPRSVGYLSEPQFVEKFGNEPDKVCPECVKLLKKTHG